MFKDFFDVGIVRNAYMAVYRCDTCALLMPRSRWLAGIHTDTHAHTQKDKLPPQQSGRTAGVGAAVRCKEMISLA